MRNVGDGASREEFHRLYRRLIYGRARRAGLPHEDAEDVAQEVFKRVAETIKDVDTNPDRGSFRGWPMKLTHWRIADKFESRAKSPSHSPSLPPATPPSAAPRRSSACPRRKTTKMNGTKSGNATSSPPPSIASPGR